MAAEESKVMAAQESAAAAAENAAAKEQAAGQEGAAKEQAAASGEKEQGQTYDQAYVDQLLAEQAKAREQAVAEALKVAAMDKESKAKYEDEQAQKKLAEREAQIARRELQADVRDLLSEQGIDQSFADILIGKDLKETKARVTAFKAQYDADIQAQVQKRLVGKTPQSGNGGAVSEAAAMAAEIGKYID